MTVHGLEAELHVRPPGDEVAVYVVMAAPPSLAGAVHETTAEALPAVADTPVGAPGTPASGVTAVEAVDVAPVPAAFAAVTVKM